MYIKIFKTHRSLYNLCQKKKDKAAQVEVNRDDHM